MKQQSALGRAVMEAPTGTFSDAPELRVETISDYPSFLNLEPVWNHLDVTPSQVAYVADQVLSLGLHF